MRERFRKGHWPIPSDARVTRPQNITTSCGAHAEAQRRSHSLNSACATTGVAALSSTAARIEKALVSDDAIVTVDDAAWMKTVFATYRTHLVDQPRYVAVLVRRRREPRRWRWPYHKPHIPQPKAAKRPHQRYSASRPPRQCEVY
jgi:hypothetical protein